MRVLLVTAHPLTGSFHGLLQSTISQTLREAGHEVDLCDLYVENFDPVLDRGRANAISIRRPIAAASNHMSSG